MPADKPMILPKGTVHVWQVLLDEGCESLSGERTPLSPDELERARRFHFDRDRRRFIVCRSSLRYILSKYIAIKPHEIKFCYGPYGKPEICKMHTPQAIRFNVAHSGSVALVGLTLFKAIGVDVEQVRQVDGADGIVDRFFSCQEAREYQRLDLSERIRGFLNGWTRKEAFVKACGQGLSFPLHDFAVTLTPGVAPRLLQVHDDPCAAHHWSMFSLEICPFVAAVVVKHAKCQLQTWEFVVGGNINSYS